MGEHAKEDGRDSPTLPSGSRRAERRLTRVAVVGFAYHPAILEQGGASPLEDPLFELGRSSSLLPRTGAAPLALVQKELKALRERVRAVYIQQTLKRAQALLSSCRAWGVKIVVFPEYSLPPDALLAIARDAGDMVVIAGTHSVDRLRWDVYETLRAERSPQLGESVCPILYRERLIGLQSKLNQAVPEKTFMRPGDRWEPVEMPSGIPGPMGVLVCLDFLFREGPKHQEFVAPFLDACRFLAVPSLTPTYTLPDFEGKAWEEARRYRRPVLYCNSAEKGGSTIYVAEKPSSDHGDFPERPGRLDAGEEGVIIADIDLSWDPPGELTRYDEPRLVIPFAAATLVYRSRIAEDAYATWLDQLGRLHGETTGAEGAAELKVLDAITAHVQGSSSVLHAVRRGARGRRLERLEAEIEGMNSVERVRQLTREIILPDGVIPLLFLRSAMALGAADVIRAWLDRHGSSIHPFAEVEARLRSAGNAVSPSFVEGFTSGGKTALLAIAAAVRGDAPPAKERASAPIRVAAYVDVVENRFKEAHERAQKYFREYNFVEARALFQALLDEALKLSIGDAEPAKGMRRWAERCRLNVAACTLNLQEAEEGLRILREVDVSMLSNEGRLALAEAFAQTGDVMRARALLSDTDAADLDLSLRPRLLEVQQLVAIREGEIPEELYRSGAVHLAAAELLYEREDLGGAADQAIEALDIALAEGHLLTAGVAFSRIVVALHNSIFEEPPSVKVIPLARRGEVVRAIERGISVIEVDKLPPEIRRHFESSRHTYGVLTWDPDRPPRPAEDGAEEADPSFQEEARSLVQATMHAEDLARAGKLDEALQALPSADHHPWRNVYHRAQIMARAGQWRLAIGELSNATGKAPVEYLLAEMWLHERKPDEATRHADAAFAMLPGRGYRFLLGRCLVAAGRTETAWKYLQSFDSKSPDVLVTRAQAADVAEPSEAPKLWQRYLEERPDDSAARIRLAQAHFKLHKAEEAARIAWDAFDQFKDQFDAQAIYTCALLQRLKGEPDERIKERIREAAAYLRQRFLGDPQAEALRFQLLRSIDAEDGSIDYDLLARSGIVEVMRAEEAIRRILLLQDRGKIIQGFYGSGALPFASFCRLMGISIASAITRLIRAERGGKPQLCAPVSLSDTPPLATLEGAELLITDVELSFLQRLGLLSKLKAALGASGRLILPVEAHERIQDDFVALRPAASEGALQRLSHLIELLEGRAELSEKIPLEPSAEREIRAEHDMRVEQLDAMRSAEEVHEFVGRGHEEGWLRMMRAPAEPPKLPPLREPTDGADRDLLRDLIEEPLKEVLAIRQVMADNPAYWRVTADFFASGPLGHPGTFSRLDWSPPDYLKLSAWNRTQSARDIYIPALVRLLLPPASAEAKLFQLAELGFPDALGAPELLRLFQMRSASEAVLVLDAMEWIARDPQHVGAEYAQIRVVGVYSEAIWQAFCGQAGRDAPDTSGVSFTNAEAENVAAFLLRRLDTLDEKAQSTTLERAISFIGLKTAERFRDSFVPSGNRMLTFSEETAPAVLWRFLAAWAGEDVRRRAAYGRAIREVWCILDEFTPGGPPRHRWKPLTLAFDIAHHDKAKAPQGGAVSLEDPEKESVAILSAHWKEPPLADMGLEVTDPDTDRSATFELERVLAYGASILGKSADIYGNERTLSYPFPVEGLSVPMTATVPVEAVLLRARGPVQEDIAREWARVQGPHDGRMHMLLRAIADNPEDLRPRREYARRAATALFRFVRDYPGFLRAWPRRGSLTEGARTPRIADLRDILSEPEGNLQEDKSIEDIVIERVIDGGVWTERADRRELFMRTAEMPGSLAAAPLGNRLAETGYASEVERALEHLRDADEHPAGRLAADLIFLGVAASDKPRVSLPKSGDIDLREQLPARIVELLNGLTRPVTPTDTVAGRESGGAIPTQQDLTGKTTMASAEGALLRVCQDVVTRLAARSGRLPVRDRLWLTYRLFQWLCSQLEALPPSARDAGLTDLVERAPGVSENVDDLLNPSHFARERFDFRLAAVLHALTVSEEIIKGAQTRSGHSTAAPRRVSSNALEEELAKIAERPCHGEERTSKLPWHAVGHVPDLALVTLMRLNSEALIRLSAEARLRRIEALPREPDLEPDPRKGFTKAFITALADHIGNPKVKDIERTAFEAKLKSMDESPTSRRYRSVGYTCLFGAGAVHLEAEARRSLVAYVDEDPLASVLCGRFLMGIAALDPDRLDAEVEKLLSATALLNRTPDPGPAVIAAGLGRVAIHGSPNARVAARALLARLATRPFFKDDPQMAELLRFLDVSRAPS